MENIFEGCKVIAGVNAAAAAPIQLTYRFTDKDGNEVLRFTPEGELFWNSKKVETEKELVMGFRNFLSNY